MFCFQTLAEMCPLDSEVSKIARFRLKPGEQLGPVELFMLELNKVSELQVQPLTEIETLLRLAELYVR
jgi:hypothetical protein